MNWPEFRHDLSLTGIDPTEAMLGLGNVSSLTRRWTQATGNGVESSLNAATGAVEWTGPTGASIDSSPAVASGVVYVGSADTNVHAYSLP